MIAASCGGTSKAEPTQKDIDAVAAAVSDIVFQCRLFTTGQIASPDAQALKRDVETLLDAYGRLEPDTTFEVGSNGSLQRKTTLRKQLRFGARVLADRCSPEQSGRLKEAADD